MPGECPGYLAEKPPWGGWDDHISGIASPIGGSADLG